MGFCIAGLRSEPDSRVIAGMELESAKPACNLSSPLSNQVSVCVPASVCRPSGVWCQSAFCLQTHATISVQMRVIRQSCTGFENLNVHAHVAAWQTAA